MLPAIPPSLPPVTAFLAAHPRYAVLPAPYFEAGTSQAAYLDVDLKPGAFLGKGQPWSLEIDTGAVQRVGPSNAPRYTAFVACRNLAKVEVRLFDVDHHVRARFTLPIRPRRFASAYQVGPYTHQVSRAWGEDGCALVAIQQRYPARFDRLKQPVLYVGGDFNYQRIENLVKYFRTHGVEAYGYKPDYDRDPGESLLQMGQRDALDVDPLVGGRPTHLVGLCLGGLLARAMASQHKFASVTTVGAPHTGSRLADVYNGVSVLPALHRFVTGDPRLHKYKDAHNDMVAFNAACDVKFRGIVLDAHDRPLDRRYDVTAAALRWLEGPQVHSDGLILSEGQAFGQPLAVWNTDHAGMINDGLAATYFDAYAAHTKLLEGLE